MQLRCIDQYTCKCPQNPKLLEKVASIRISPQFLQHCPTFRFFYIVSRRWNSKVQKCFFSPTCSTRVPKNVPFILSDIYLSIYSCCSHFEHRASVKRFVSLQFLNLRQSVGLLGRGISPSQGRYLHTGQHKRRINAYRHPCLEWDSNPRFQRSNGRRHFMP
jgi:hypothetical protein